LLACLIVAPQRATMSQKSPLTQSAHSVRQVLTAYKVALINSLMHVKGYAAPEPRKQVSLLIEQAEASGEALEDPLLLFSVLS
jgi:hypothetical protein